MARSSLDHLPEPPARVADLGCGTGTLSVLLAEAGYEVDGLDFSPRMVELAERKANGVPGARFVQADAFDPRLVEDAGRATVLTPLTDPAYWGRSISDDRYLVTSPAEI